MISSKQSWMFAVEYAPSGKSNLSFQAGAEILNLLLLYVDVMFFHVYIKLVNAIFLLRFLRLSLSASDNLNL